MKNYSQYLDESDIEENGYSRPRKSGKVKQSKEETLATLAEDWTDTQSAFNPTFHASRHERKWILEGLGGFYEDQLISDVVAQVKGGKEATVYCCLAHPDRDVELMAAKVYRPRIFRTLKNDQMYREGGDIADDSGQSAIGSRRAKLAMKKKTEFGHALLHGAWLSNEYSALTVLHGAGADVPKPYAMAENAILMEYLGEVGAPANALVNVKLEPREARPMFNRLLENIDLMLGHQIVHGDLSAHNILYWQGKAVIIDLPQSVASHVNPHAQFIFTRDVERVCQYFERYGIHVNAQELANDLWTRHMPD